MQTKNIPMHITLGSFDTGREEEIKELLENTARKSGPFGVTFSHTGIFGGKDVNVLFIAPDANRELLELKENFGGSSGWTPHTTMLIDRPEIVYKAVPAVTEMFSAFGGRVEELFLYEFWPARHIMTVRLGEEKHNK